MGNLFFGLNVARSALLTNQAALDVAGHNLANVQTEGYSKQRATLVPSLAVKVAEHSFGSGVTVESVERLQTIWLERQINRVQVQTGYAEALQTGIDELQGLLGEPSSQGVATALSEFWSGWEALSVQPADAALRGQVLEQTRRLVDVYNEKIESLLDVERRFNEALDDTVQEVNALTERLAELNGAIAKASAGGNGAADLEDQRDVLVRQVSEKLGVEVESDGSYVNLRIQDGGPYLLSRNQSFPITPGSTAGGVVSDFRVEPGPARLSGGEIGALLALEEEISPNLRADLSGWMSTVVDRVNQLHGSGFDRDGEAGRNLISWEGDSSSVALSSQLGILSVGSLAGMQPGTHHLEVSLAENLVDFAAGDGRITLTETGAFSGSLAGPNYYVGVVTPGTAPAYSGLQVALFRDGAQVGAAVSPVLDDPAAPTSARYSWTGVDGMTFSANIDLDGSPFSSGQRSDVHSAAISLDGGPPAFVDISAENSVTFTGGSDRGFEPGGTVSVAFAEETFSGATFTSYASAGRLAVDSFVLADIDRIAAAAVPGSVGDGEIARRIAALAEGHIFEDTDETPSSYLARIVQSLGMKGRDAEVQGESGRSILLQLEAQREGEVGVNLDEEMVLLIQYQRGFEAAARLLTTLDGLLDTLINSVGR